MKKSYCILRFTFTIILFLEVSFLSAQHEYDVWFFGTNAGVDFSSGAPVVVNGGQVNTEEGSASIADGAGNLLFYSDGVTVWNKNHQVMSNGTGLHGDNSSSQSALIIQLPGSDSLYYIFTTGAQLSNGFEYSIVDMSLQGNLGEVILKNVPLLSVCTEKLTAARHSNGTDYWVLIHGWNNNNFYACQFSAAGVNPTPVISSVGTVHTGSSTDCIGYMRTSPKGEHLALCLHETNYFELFDFDKTTGTVSNALFIDGIVTTLGPYGVEFSPNDSLLYGAEYQPGKILQWDISSGNAATIIASQNLVGTTAAFYGGALALASDGKIYMAERSEPWLGAIESPNVYGPGCNYVDHSFNLSPNLNLSGLPNVPSFWFYDIAGVAPAAAFFMTDTVFCESNCIDFTDQSANAPTSWQWQFPGGSPSTSTLQNPVDICYNTAGTYDVTLIASNSAGSDTLTLSNFITILTAPVAAITQFGNTLSTNSAFSYQWSYNGSLIPGATNQELEISQTGSYSVTVTDNSGCSDADTLVVTFIPANNLSATDTLLCQKFCIDFTDQSTNSPTAWLWQFPGGIPSSSTNQNPNNICYDNPGTFDVTLITTNAFGTDTLTLIDYITVFSTPPFPIITQSGYTLTSTLADSYQWQFNSVDIPGATNQSYTSTQTGFYTVVVSDVNGCVSATTIYVEITGIEDLISEQNILIYPNPSNGSFIVEWLNGSIAGSIRIEIYNALGQVVFLWEESQFIGTSELKKEIDLTYVASGIYFVEISAWVDAGKPGGKYLSRKKLLVR